MLGFRTVAPVVFSHLESRHDSPCGLSLPAVGYAILRVGSEKLTSPSCWLSSGQVFFAVFFSFNFVFELLLSKNRWAFVMSILGIVDLVTIVPVFVALSVDPVVKSPTGFVRLYRVLMLGRVRSGVD